MVRDPPRKSEQTTCRAVQSSRGQREQLRCKCCPRGCLRPGRECPAQQCTEQRRGHDGERQYRLRLPRSQRERHLRLLNAVSRQTAGRAWSTGSRRNLVLSASEDALSTKSSRDLMLTGFGKGTSRACRTKVSRACRTRAISKGRPSHPGKARPGFCRSIRRRRRGRLRGPGLICIKLYGLY